MNDFFSLSFENVTNDKKFWLRVFLVHQCAHAVGFKDDTKENRNIFIMGNDAQER